MYKSLLDIQRRIVISIHYAEEHFKKDGSWEQAYKDCFHDETDKAIEIAASKDFEFEEYTKLENFEAAREEILEEIDGIKRELNKFNRFKSMPFTCPTCFNNASRKIKQPEMPDWEVSLRNRRIEK